MCIKINKQLINGATLLGTALTLFGVGTIVQELYQKLIMFGAFLIFLIFSLFAFFEKN